LVAHLQYIDDLLCDLDGAFERLADNDPLGEGFEEGEECLPVLETTVESLPSSDLCLMLHPRLRASLHQGDFIGMIHIRRGNASTAMGATYPAHYDM
jgi:hypothetical protein